MIEIRAATADDRDAIWDTLEPIVRAGEVFALPRELSRAAGLAYWLAPAHEVFVAELERRVPGAYYLRRFARGELRLRHGSGSHWPRDRARDVRLRPQRTQRDQRLFLERAQPTDRHDGWLSTERAASAKTRGWFRGSDRAPVTGTRSARRL